MEGWKFEEDNFILCEGSHDKDVIDFLINERGLGSFQIKTSHECVGIGGTSGFGPAIQGFPPITGFKALQGIAIITDNDSNHTIPNLKRKLERFGFIPNSSYYGGSISDKPAIIVPLPGGIECGDLEKMCLPALYSFWPDSEQCVMEYLECTQALNWKKQNQLWKARVRSIISGYYEDDPYKGLGYMIKDKRYKSLARHKCFDKLAYVLKQFSLIINNPRILETDFFMRDP